MKTTQSGAYDSYGMTNDNILTLDLTVRNLHYHYRNFHHFSPKGLV